MKLSPDPRLSPLNRGRHRESRGITRSAQIPESGFIGGRRWIIAGKHDEALPPEAARRPVQPFSALAAINPGSQHLPCLPSQPGLAGAS